jgi:hypothetical protein
MLSVTLNGQLVRGIVSNLPDEVNTAFGTYHVCESSGISQPETFSGWWISTLIEAAGSTPQTASMVTIQRIAWPYGKVTLTPPDFDRSTHGGLDFPEGEALLVTRNPFDAKAGPFQFFRPYRGSPAEGCVGDHPNLNWEDYVAPSGTQRLRIAITAGTVLHVQASASSPTPKAGTTDRFTAAVTNPPTGISLTYTWNFGDGTTSQGPTVTHAFTSPGSYDVIATVTGTDRSGGSAQVNVNVGKTQGSPGHGTTTTTVGVPRLPTVGSHAATTPAVEQPGGTSSAGPTGVAPAGAASSKAGAAGTGSNRPTASATSKAASTGSVSITRPAPLLASSLVSVHGVLVGGAPVASGISSPSGSAQIAQGPVGRHRSVHAMSLAPFAVVAAVLALLVLGVFSERRPRLRRR